MKAKHIILAIISLMAIMPARAERLANHVIVIALDAWGSYSFDKSKMPNVRAEMERGSWTLEKRTVLPSNTTPNFCSMFMGAGIELHGFDANTTTPNCKQYATGVTGLFPNIFEVLRAQDPAAEIGCVYEWANHLEIMGKQSFNYIKQSTNIYSSVTADMAADYIIKNRPTLGVVIFDNPDHIGHVKGHNTPEFYYTLEELDSYVGTVIDAIRQAGIYDDTVIILTADHGGINKGHGGRTIQEIRTPFIISGRNIRNAGETTNVMAQYDVAATIARILDLKQPDIWQGRPATWCIEGTPQPVDNRLQADLLDVVFNPDGTATDISALGNRIEVIGSPKVVRSLKYGRNIFCNASEVWGGTPKAYYRFNMNDDFWGPFADGHTMECMIRPHWDGYSIPSGWVAMLSAQQGAGVGLIVDGKKWRYEPRINDRYYAQNNPKAIENDRWVHLVGVWDRDAGQVAFYVDGVKVSSQAVSGKLVPLDVDEPWMGIGCDYKAADLGEAAFKGDIALARIYSRPLDDADVKALYDCIADSDTGLDEHSDVPGTGTPCADVLDLKFDMSDNSIRDASPMGNTVVASPGMVTVNSPTLDMDIMCMHDNKWTAVHNGTSYARVPVTGEIWRAVKDGMTIEGYVRPQWNGTLPTGGEAHILGMEAGAGFALYSGSGRWLMEVHCGGSYRSARATAPESGRWTHVVGVWDKSAGKVKIYLDGQLKATADAAGDLRFPLGSTYMGIGGDFLTGNEPTSAFQGDLAICRVYGRPLTDEQVTPLYVKADALNTGKAEHEDSSAGVDDVTADRHDDDDNYYDLLGRRVVNPSRGIYLHRGKKIIIKEKL